MIKIGKTTYTTISDVTEELGGVSTKTIREWIEKKIIPEPPKISWGVREILHFSREYVEEAKVCLDRYREQKARQKGIPES